ncbi:pyridoxine 4-dehydrogenase [Marchantia polymorpha subsp. ruderalis]|uniref:NADP-dependent oxidoreductase domain-containing protein n=2 Tax=Marchantia polymorpha TaxID=3197 RepID=A0A176WPC2_MARPO|nr:hypothetical protein AXG93_2891s1570 [Marchantia polymorpha subsp. ruderalis]PTQ39092.1 hypothetical protein MARPO_0047s0072 [Marchantia polymorpha]BBN14749.1 hypothetical protein Mp_6g14180 [Marchantia polymorpha subsp. ruderalis]|eukprot:PTQ39092.1 hypothetical protein MARPO_0047s0072 [Marchantia polymorpha]
MATAKVALGSQGFQVSPQGLGCMGMSSFYGPQKPEEEMIALIHKAVEHGITLLDTSDVYGPHTNEILVGKAVKGIRDKVQICTKFALHFDGKGMSVRGDPEYVRASCEGSLKRLDVECIDLYYQHRVDTKVPIEITMGELKKLIQEGKIKYIGLSEASAADIRRAHAVHPLTAIQLEYSLWTRDVEDDIIPTCRELGIGIIAYSPLGRGFLSGKNLADLSENDIRKNHPRFSSENFQQNKRFYDKLVAMGAERNCTPGQLALAWVQHKGAIPIPGTTKWENLQQNISSLDIKLTPEDIKALEDAVPHQEVQGDRSSDMSKTWIYTVSPPLESWTGSRH